MDSQISQLLKQFGRINRAMHKPGRACRAPGELAIMGALAYLCKDKKEGIKASSVSGYLELAQPTITPILRKLEEEGKIIRSVHPEDRRIALIRLSPKGEASYQEFLERRREEAEGLVDYLTPEGTQQLIELLTKTADYFSGLSTKEREQGEHSAGEAEGSGRYRRRPRPHRE